MSDAGVEGSEKEGSVAEVETRNGVDVAVAEGVAGAVGAGCAGVAGAGVESGGAAGFGQEGRWVVMAWCRAVSMAQGTHWKSKACRPLLTLAPTPDDQPHRTGETKLEILKYDIPIHVKTKTIQLL